VVVFAESKVVVGRGDRTVLAEVADLFKTFSFSGELAVAEELRREVVAGRVAGDLALVEAVEEAVPLTFGFAAVAKLVGFEIGALK
jgi:hypothetical protein